MYCHHQPHLKQSVLSAVSKRLMYTLLVGPSKGPSRSTAFWQMPRMSLLKAWAASSWTCWNVPLAAALTLAPGKHRGEEEGVQLQRLPGDLWRSGTWFPPNRRQ